MTTPFPIEKRTGSIEPNDLPHGHLHIVVFGPGEGEAILVRTPDGRVGVIDGCGEPSPKGRSIHDLVALLLDDKEKLLFACLTHPHEDHYRGFAKLIEAFPPENLWWSGSYERKFFNNYLGYLESKGADKEVDSEVEPSARSLGRVVAAIRDLAGKRDLAKPRAQHLTDWKRILRHANGYDPVQIESILPSSNSVCAAEEDTAKGILKGDDSADRTFDPNRISAALLLTWGRTRVLLGGDAFCDDRDPHAGWNGLQFPLDKVHLIKVAHHASKEAHSDALWSQMNPDLAIVTCFKKASRQQPPRPEMLKTILDANTKLVVTSRPDWWGSLPHNLLAEHGGGWPRLLPSPASATTRRIKPRPAPRAHGFDNAALVRLNNLGQIVHVGLYGDAQELRK